MARYSKVMIGMDRSTFLASSSRVVAVCPELRVDWLHIAPSLTASFQGCNRRDFSLPAHIPPQHLLQLPSRPIDHFGSSPPRRHLIADSLSTPNLTSRRRATAYSGLQHTFTLTFYSLSPPPPCARQEQGRGRRAATALAPMPPPAILQAL